ncbi:MAG TPA: hydroxyisourate hydrolase [Actinomycetota bacterium]|nr:hydroxyisourate hydrolase [Actinomycetota bacterium]
MSAITTHVLDISAGRPAAGLAVVLEFLGEEGWTRLGAGATDGDGRVASLLPDGQPVEAGTYRLTFDTGGYFAARGVTGLYPEVVVAFDVADPGDHHHVPLLLSPFGYSTYRGS